MRILGIDLTLAPAESSVVSLFRGEPIDVSKASLPSGASIDGPASDRLSSYAAAQGLGSTQPAAGVRPNPGVLPNAAAEIDADPLRFQIPWGGNISYTPRSGFGTPFSILRSLAATAPVIALCIQCRKDQMASLEFDFAARDKKQKDTALDGKVARAREFFAKPDRVTPFKTWVQTLVDEVLTLDALSIYKRPTKLGAAKKAEARTKGQSYQLAPDELYGYEIRDGSTFKVLLDGRGDVPAPPDIGYRQIIYGTPIAGGDCTQDELLYLPKNVRTWTPYGMSPLETVLLIVTADLNRALFNLSYYAEGNIPEALVGVPNSWSPKQITQFNEYWDLVLRGDPKNRSKLRFVVETMAKTVHEFRKPDFTTAYDLWLLKLQCACYGVTPSEVGFTDDVNKATSKTQGDVNQRRGIKPMANFIKGLLDAMLATDLGMPEIEATWSGGEGEDALGAAKIIDLNLRNGRLSLDEVRAQDGNPTLGAGPAMYTATGPIFIEDVIAQSATAGVSDTGGDDDPDVTPPASGEAPPLDAAAIAQQAELKKYRTVALKAVKARRPVPVFTSAVISAPTLARLSRALTTAASFDDVRKVFANVEKAQRLSAAQKKHQQQMTSTLTSILAAERRALAAHVAAGVDASA